MRQENDRLKVRGQEIGQKPSELRGTFSLPISQTRPLVWRLVQKRRRSSKSAKEARAIISSLESSRMQRRAKSQLFYEWSPTCLLRQCETNCLQWCIADG